MKTLKDSARLVIALLALLACMLIAGLAWWQTRVAEEGEMQANLRQAELQARAFGEHADSVVRLVDLALLELTNSWTDWPSFHARAATVSQQLGNLSVQVAAADGTGLLASTNLAEPKEKISLADREHIRVHLDGKVDGLFISNPVLGRVSKKWSVQFTRAVRREGQIKGVIVISIDPQYFADFYTNLSEPKSGDIITMLKPNGVVLARAPDAARYLGQSLANAPFLTDTTHRAGSYVRPSPIDGIERINGWYRAPYSGLVLVSGMSRQAAMAGFERQRNWVWSAAGALMLLVGAAAWGLGRTLRVRGEQAERLRQDKLGLESAVAERTTALRQSVEQLQASQVDLQIARTALDSASNGIAIVDAIDPAMPLIYANDAFERITGFSKAEVMGRNLRFLHEGDPDQPDLDVLREALRQGQACRVRLRNYRKNGEAFNNELSISPLRGADGRITHYVGIQTDVTDRVRLENQVRESQKLEAIGQLTGGLAHDFNNLLGVVIGNLDGLAERLPADETLRRQHAAALDAALRGAEVTRSLLAVARRQPLQVQVQDLNAIVGELTPLIRSSAGESVEVRTQLADSPLPAQLDASGLSNAVLNVVTNACDAMRGQSGEQRLVLRTRREQVLAGADPHLAPGEYAVLEISDTGPGMSEEIRSRAFDPFFTTKPMGRGTGLGLSMVRGFAEQLGGTARIESTLGRGTTVELLLPLGAQRVAA